MGGCPPNSHCEWGFCECNRGGHEQVNFEKEELNKVLIKLK